MSRSIADYSRTYVTRYRQTSTFSYLSQSLHPGYQGPSSQEHPAIFDDFAESAWDEAFLSSVEAVSRSDYYQVYNRQQTSQERSDREEENCADSLDNANDDGSSEEGLPTIQHHQQPPVAIDAALQFFAEEVDNIDPHNRYIRTLHPGGRLRCTTPSSSRMTKKHLASSVKRRSIAEKESRVDEKMKPYKAAKADMKYLTALAKPRKTLQDQIIGTAASSSSMKSARSSKSSGIHQKDWVDGNYKDYSGRTPKKKSLDIWRSTRLDVLERIYDQPGRSSRTPSPSGVQLSRTASPATTKKDDRKDSDNSTQCIPVKDPLIAPQRPSSAMPSRQPPASTKSSGSVAPNRGGRRIVDKPSTTKEAPTPVEPPAAVTSTKSGSENSGSKPLEWSKRFGDQGRQRIQRNIQQQKELQRKQESILEQNLTLSTKPEDLLDLYHEMVKILWMTVEQDMKRAATFAVDYCLEMQGNPLSQSFDASAATTMLGKGNLNNESIADVVLRAEVVQLMDDLLSRFQAPTTDVDAANQIETRKGIQTTSSSFLSFQRLHALLAENVINVRGPIELGIILAWVLNDYAEQSDYDGDGEDDVIGNSKAVDDMAKGHPLWSQHHLLFQEVRHYVAGATETFFDRSVNRDRDEKHFYHQLRIYFRDAPVRIYAEQGRIPRSLLRNSSPLADQRNSKDRVVARMSTLDDAMMTPTHHSIANEREESQHVSNLIGTQESLGQETSTGMLALAMESYRAAAAVYGQSAAKKRHQSSKTSVRMLKSNASRRPQSPENSLLFSPSQQESSYRSLQLDDEKSDRYLSPGRQALSISTSLLHQPHSTHQQTQQDMVAVMKPFRPSSAGPVRPLGVQHSMSALKQPKEVRSITPRKPRVSSHELSNSGDASEVVPAMDTMEVKNESQINISDSVSIRSLGERATRRTADRTMLKVSVHVHIGFDLYLRAYEGWEPPLPPLPPPSTAPPSSVPPTNYNNPSTSAENSRKDHPPMQHLSLPSALLTPSQRLSIISTREVHYDLLRRPDIMTSTYKKKRKTSKPLNSNETETYTQRLPNDSLSLDASMMPATGDGKEANAEEVSIRSSSPLGTPGTPGSQASQGDMTEDFPTIDDDIRGDFSFAATLDAPADVDFSHTGQARRFLAHAPIITPEQRPLLQHAVLSDLLRSFTVST